jgi:hypothetical protein
MSINGFTSETHLCVDCGQAWELTASEADWFAQRDMRLPRRCKPCRHARRLAQQQQPDPIVPLRTR